MKGLVDSTLREGEQTPGVLFSLAEKIKIATLSSQVGIEEIEIGIASPRDTGLPALIQACRQKTASRLALWCRCVSEDIIHAAKLDPDVLSLSIPASDMHLTEKMQRNRKWAVDTLKRSIQLARTMGFTMVSVGLEDATRADENFLKKLTTTAHWAGATRVRLADTVGIASPTEITRLVTLLKKSCPVEIGIHAHNDFGMATANSIAALEAGADWADATVLGLGERAGNSRLEEMVGYLSLQAGTRSYKTIDLRALCNVVADAAAQKIDAGHPVVGDSIFTCETGLHLQGLHRNPATYEPYDPKLVGATRKLQLGSKVGTRAVKDRLSSLGYELTEEKTGKIVSLIHKQAKHEQRPLSDAEISSLAQEVCPLILSQIQGA